MALAASVRAQLPAVWSLERGLLLKRRRRLRDVHWATD